MPSRTPQIMGGTDESCSGTELPLCHSLKPKAFGSGRSKITKLNFVVGFSSSNHMHYHRDLLSKMQR